MQNSEAIIEVLVDPGKMQATVRLSDDWQKIAAIHKIYMLTDVVAQLTFELDQATREWKRGIDDSRRLDLWMRHQVEDEE